MYRKALPRPSWVLLVPLRLKRYSRAYGVADGRVLRRFGSDRERRRRRANALYEFEMVLREESLSDFVYDAKQDLFRFPDGRFAFSGE
jgi:hypothetical protein